MCAQCFSLFWWAIRKMEIAHAPRSSKFWALMAKVTRHYRNMLCCLYRRSAQRNNNLRNLKKHMERVFHAIVWHSMTRLVDECDFVAFMWFPETWKSSFSWWFSKLSHMYLHHTRARKVSVQLCSGRLQTMSAYRLVWGAGSGRDANTVLSQPRARAAGVGLVPAFSVYLHMLNIFWPDA